ncbi:acyl-CoA dehydrogenase family protein [Nocardia sp. NPDC005366]|uniref:acyl-CoA dehydrogenase family protein n=1 Tax=Nocardia sp. NPDC005366 TaxID=3156878 RepID=UPI0033BAFF5B
MTDSLEIDRDELRAAVQQVLGSASSSKAVRAMVDPVDPVALRVFRDQIAQVGWTGIDIPEKYGGAGASFADLAVVLVEIGSHLSPGPLLASSVLAATALLAGSSQTQRSAWLPLLAEGSVVGTAAVAERSAPAGGRLRIEHDQVILDGSWSYVPDAPEADFLVVHATDAAGGDALVLVLGDAAGLTRTATEMHDQTRRFGKVDARGVALPADAVLCTGADATAAGTLINERAALATACDSLGLAERTLTLTLSYLKERVQFDRVIGSFQAVKHQAADMLISVETARVIVHEALDALAADRADREILVSMAKSYACDAAADVVALGVTLHGGMGFTWEHDLHFLLKRAKLNQVLFGSSRAHRRHIADLDLGPVTVR